MSCCIGDSQLYRNRSKSRQCSGTCVDTLPSSPHTHRYLQGMDIVFSEHMLILAILARSNLASSKFKINGFVLQLRLLKNRGEPSTSQH